MKKKTVLYVAVLNVAFANAQGVTYNHDSAKMNQITVAEIASGGLTPTWYYYSMHRSYQRTAAEKNKMAYRTAAGIAAYQQVDMAAELDSALRARAEIEALNVADRSGGALDVAWLAEGDKINAKLDTYEENIRRILMVGGNADNQKHWKEYDEIFKCGIKAMQDAYQPNSQRKKQYLQIYADICRKNEELVHYIVRLSNSQKTSDLLRASYEKPNRTAEIVTEAMNRWREAGWQQARN